MIEEHGAAVSAVINIAAYRFAHLQELKPLRERLLASCRTWGLKGTILLSPEGINLFVAGGGAEIRELLSFLRRLPGLADLEPKFSESRTQPFDRMLVKIKKEIITFAVPDIDPIGKPAPRLSPAELKQWLDEERPVTLLDTRNDFEVRIGTFRGAIPIGIKHFRDFPSAADKLSPSPHPIVTFCTGGIRCEKAAPYLIERGHQRVFQLDGGILKYFEQCGNMHFMGECFVFDQRVSLAADLGEAEQRYCVKCQRPFTPETPAHQDPSCQRCRHEDVTESAEALARRRLKLKEVTAQLSQGEPQDNLRPLKVLARHAGATLYEMVRDRFRHMDAVGCLHRFAAGEFVDIDRRPVEPHHRVQAGERYYTLTRGHREPAVNLNIEIIHEDSALIVINKPAPLPMHPSGRYNRHTLQAILSAVYAPERTRPAHRLDANTSGVAVFTRSSAFARKLQPQFERGVVQKHYLARVIGAPPCDRFDCDAPIAPAGLPCGARIVNVAAGLPARTEFAVLERFDDGTTLLQALPLTGRTNQIRVHLWQLGFPIVGDPMYRPGQHLGNIQTLQLTDPPLCLLAWKVAFDHPVTAQRVSFTAPDPEWIIHAGMRALTPA